MEKNYFTNKEIIFGLRNDFIKRNSVLLEIKKLLVPLKKDINIDVHYDNLNEEINLTANYDTTYLGNLVKKLLCQKYTYEAIIRNNKRSNNIELYENSDSIKKIFPIEFDIATFCSLNQLFQKLLSLEYDVVNQSDSVFSLYNCLVLLGQKNGLLSNMLEYNPIGDVLSVYSEEDNMYKDHFLNFLKIKHDKDLFSQRARETIENSESSSKQVILVDYYGDTKEMDFSIREREDKIILVKKLKR